MQSRPLRTTILATALAAAGLLGFAAQNLGPVPAAEIAVEPVSLPVHELAEPLRLERAAEPVQARIAVELPVAPALPAVRRSSAAASARRAESARESAGRLLVHAIDAETGAPLVQVRLRALNAARFADEDGGLGRGDLELALTPGAYSILVLSNGYEPVESSVGLGRGESSERTIALRGGSARIEGRVRGDFGPDAALRVELVGKGRRPCPSCANGRGARSAATATAWVRADPCRVCGYSGSASVTPLGADGAFAFERLASGHYAVRLVDREGRTVGAPRALELREAESARIELEAATPRYVEVEFVDTDGSSLAGDWARRFIARERPTDAPDVIPAEVTMVSSLRWTCSFRDAARCVARAEFETPLREGYATWCRGISRCCGLGVSRAGIDDRERDGTETLRPAAVVPKLAPDPIDGEVDARGLVLFGPLPPWALTLEAHCAGYACSVAVPAASSTRRVRAVVTATRGERDEPEGPAGASGLPLQVSPTFRAVDASRYL